MRQTTSKADGDPKNHASQTAGSSPVASASHCLKSFLAIGKIDRIYYTAIFTERGDNIRIISVRRSRSNERILHEQNQP